MKRNKSLKQNLKKFLDSDSGYATATKVILAAIAFAGVVFIIATAPNIFQAFGGFKKSKHYSKNQLKNAFHNLKRRKFIKIIKESDDKVRVELTNKGQKRIKEFSIDIVSISKPRKWDKRWRVVIFDIPTKFHKAKFDKAREALRSKLKELGFFQLQKSVWIFPYPCEDEILFISNIFEVEPFVEILTVEKMLHENKIRNFFGL